MSSKAVAYFPEGFSGVAETEQPRHTEAAEQPRGETSSEEALLVAVGKGSKEALGDLYRSLARIVYSVAIRILEDAGEAEDLVHEVFLALHEHAHRFDPSKGTARTWILCIASNRALNRRAFLKARKHYQSDELLESQFLGALAISSEQASVDMITARKLLELLPIVLSPEQRRTLEMHFVRGFTFREIAEELSMPLNSVHKQYYRACARLRAHILQQKDTDLG